MDLVTEVGDRVYLIAQHFEDARVGYQAFFIASEKPTLIEPGPSPFISKIVVGLNELGYDVASLSYIIPTHIHADHCGGTGNLIQSAHNAKILAHYEGVKHLIDPTKMMEASRAYWGEYYESEIGALLPVPESKIEVVQGGENIDLGDRTLAVVYTPGHAKHHICLYDSESGELFAGEALGLPLPGNKTKVVPVVSPPVFELEAALDSIDRLRMLKPSKIFYSHYGIGQRAKTCLDLAEKNTKLWGDIVLQALKDGKDRDEIKTELAAHLGEIETTNNEIFSQLLEWATDGYTGYFTRECMVTPSTRTKEE